MNKRRRWIAKRRRLVAKLRIRFRNDPIDCNCAPCLLALVRPYNTFIGAGLCCELRHYRGY